ncbi:CDP-diacylglycerol--serine O-phosphatidyltransferase [Polychytrium aggregatum]|uniref:CDP-diacylglycerol--serine O-phosphatidyltransferase n=1 Tax=Polychytrium aggregatum TaxID=110093 RepID=UPI0022FF2BC2|nr:CDP-diacylglycerol--serine O-phosphatidyltransferase [Polychytrium aggregatum]KAI9209920.1 CDP-diacylglycerol--serine O-phosphatidyltransferase [Polychytrium aggregatum]
MSRRTPAASADPVGGQPRDVHKPVPKRTRHQPRYLSLVRGLFLADIVTLCNSASGCTSILASLKYVTTQNEWFLYAAIWLLPAALFFDIIDGKVARWRGTESQLGQELDSLADVISFGVAPAVLGFAVGLQGLWDLLILLYFVNCGVARLARYNVTAITNKDHTGKVRFFEGTPIPTTVLIALLIAYLSTIGLIGDVSLPGGKFIFAGWTFHPFVLVYAISGTAQISKNLRIPKF